MKNWLTAYIRGRVVKAGYIEGDTFHKTVDRKKHYMRVVGGYGIQSHVFNQLNVKNIKLKEKRGKTWTIPLEVWKEHGKEADYGYGKQVFLSENYYETIRG